MTQNNPHLVPTVVVDRNGKTTTVHKKPNTPVKEGNFSKPVLPEAKPTDKMTGEEIAYTVIKRLKNLTPPTGVSRITVTPDLRQQLLEASKDPEYIRNIHSMFENLASHGPDTFAVITTIISNLQLTDKSRIDVLCSNQEYLLSKDPTAVLEIAFFGSRLIKEGIAKPEGDSHIPSLEAHFKAKSQYFKQYGEQFGYYGDGNGLHDYRKNVPYMKAVEEHYEQIERLMEYRKLRGIEITNGKDQFDQDDFRRYLEQGAVANGWL